MTWYEICLANPVSLIILAIPVVVFVSIRLIRSLKISDFHRKHVVITGCDSGFGRELAVRLDQMGFLVHAGCLTDDGQDSLRQLATPRMHTFPLDISDPASIVEAHDNIAAQLSTGLWALVNNAGISGVEAPIEMCPVSDFVYAMKVNLYGHVAMTKTFLPLIRKAKGRVINMSSAAGRLACVSAPYCISQFALEAFSDCLRRELSPFGVKVSIIEPGLFKTEIFNTAAFRERATAVYDLCSSEEVRQAYGEDYPSTMNKQYAYIVRKASEDTYLVCNAYVNAITCRYPKTRYVVGKNARFVLIPATFMPDWLTDSVIKFVKNRIT